jgi:ribosomal protein L11 methyltransferase
MIRLAVRAPTDVAERVLAAMSELAPDGFEQVDGDGYVEFAVYGAPGELPELPEGEAEVAGVAVVVSGAEVPDDWAERWKRFHVPLLIGGELYVRPPWEEPPLRPGVHDVVIDPGRAFGTGTHPTTRLCLELLLEVRDEIGLGHSLADLGCGSGVLAIAAAKLGFGPITAVDSDREAVAATDRNARANAVQLDQLERVNLREQPPPEADVVVANLARPLLERLAARVEGRPRRLIAAGLLDEEANAALAAFAPLVERRRLSLRGWTALLLA